MEDRLSCADFRARRERMGLSQRDAYKGIKASKKSLYNWESPLDNTHNTIPPRAWDWLKSKEHEFNAIVDGIVASADTPHVDGFALLTYPKDSDMLRAATRAAGERLMARGIEVMYVYDED